MTYQEWKPIFKGSYAKIADIVPDLPNDGVKKNSVDVGVFCHVLARCENEDRARNLFDAVPKMGADFLDYAAEADSMVERDASQVLMMNLDPSPEFGPFRILAGVVHNMVLPDLQAALRNAS